MKVLGVASEVFPLVKTGGLADVAGALPVALAKAGVATRTLLPGYPQVLSKLASAEPVHVFPDLFGGSARLLAANHAGLDLLIIDAPHLYDRPGNIYVDADGFDWPDNAQRFAALSWVGAWIGKGHFAGFQPDVVHAHDWQAGLTPAYLKFWDGPGARSVITIHNIAFQGHFGLEVFSSLDLPPAAFSFDGVEYFGGVGYLKGGLALADAITTVSPTYAQEITTPAFGMGLDGLIRHRASVLSGIVNGIDTDVWNPQTDSLLPGTFSATSLEGRAACRAALEARLGLTGDGIILTVISRLTWQKGLDVLADCLDEVVAMGARIAVLGSGERAIEDRFVIARERHPGRVGVQLGYDEALAHLIQAGGDAILVPSRFEPCGLTQLCALRYGSVPVVSRVGGLNDTIVDANDAALAAGVATGIQFGAVDRDALLQAVRRTMLLYSDADTWTRMQTNGLKADVSWSRSAQRYAQLYSSLTN
jgi:starch synthase